MIKSVSSAICMIGVSATVYSLDLRDTGFVTEKWMKTKKTITTNGSESYLIWDVLQPRSSILLKESLDYRTKGPELPARLQEKWKLKKTPQYQTKNGRKGSYLFCSLELAGKTVTAGFLRCRKAIYFVEFVRYTEDKSRLTRPYFEAFLNRAMN